MNSGVDRATERFAPIQLAALSKCVRFRQSSDLALLGRGVRRRVVGSVAGFGWLACGFGRWLVAGGSPVNAFLVAETARGAKVKPGDHIRNRRVKGGTWVVLKLERSRVRVRCLDTGTPATISRRELDRWEVAWSPLEGPGYESLYRWTDKVLRRVDAPQPRVTLGGAS
jgi:hypothetical protein